MRRTLALCAVTILALGVASLVEHGHVHTLSARRSTRSALAGPQAPSGLSRGPGSKTPTGASSSSAAPTTVTTSGAGALPQTGAFPSSASPQFAQEMAALWSAVVSDVPSRALPAFFPEAAYVQLKTVSNPAGDWTDRLVAGYNLDIAAAHQLLGPNAASAKLVSVDVPGAAAHWVPPGVCYNQVGYFEVPNARVVYQVDGQVSSFGIASLISWRGQWYVVHLGAVIESPGVAAVDAPATGPGYSAPSSTC